MNYQTFKPHPYLESFVHCYWTLEVPAEDDAQKQRIIPDGCIEMAFILGDDIKRYTSEEEFTLQPRAMIIGQTIEPFYIQPTGYVNTFAIRFYPYGFASFISESLQNFVNKEIPLHLVFGEAIANELEQKMIKANDTKERIAFIEKFLFDKLSDKITVNKIVNNTIDTLLSTQGDAKINNILKQNLCSRRQLERKFSEQIGISPKQLAKVIRLQAALKILLNEETDSLTNIAYKSKYYDQSHFVKDFKKFTGMSPKEFLGNKNMALSSLLYK
ncbi:AraC family transcriptional regulator [Marinicrinis sediminis]|uniref:DUF6597 domain-containing transcriptional factor n=1 Tax=Marinicrinis sediminis TaxID=1652465 RepID=A0ABW5RBQ1_9BACL